MKYEVRADTRPYMVFYPCLMKSVSGRDAMVLFTSQNTGMELLPNGFGESEDDWIAADNQKAWKPFVGTITITP